MAKGKNLNPADAYRKAQRKKELAKNKEARKGAKELAVVKKDTSAFEEEIAKLLEQEKTAPLTAPQKTRLADLRGEVQRINSAKEAFVEAHPEQRKLVFRARGPKPGEAGGAAREDRTLFGKNGLPLRPERSVYYDRVMNPYGMPPPGMPYMERAPTPVEGEGEDEEMSDEDKDEDEDDDIPMPSAPRPGSEEDDSSEASSEDIPLPPGPPPGTAQPPLPSGPPPLPSGPPPLMAMPYMMPGMMGFPMLPPYGAMPMSAATMSGAPVSYSAAPSLPPPPPSLPPKPTQQAAPVEAGPQAYTIHTPLPPSQLPPSAATVSAPAALRDLKAEATAFVPVAVKRKKAAVGK